MSTIPEHTEDEDVHLAEQHGLVKTTAYIRNNSEKQRTAGAERVAKHRQKKKAQGLVQVDLPVSIADEIKASGSFADWFNQFRRLSSQESTEINQAIEIANRIAKFPRWLRRLLDV